MNLEELIESLNTSARDSGLDCDDILFALEHTRKHTMRSRVRAYSSATKDYSKVRDRISSTCADNAARQNVTHQTLHVLSSGLCVALENGTTRELLAAAAGCLGDSLVMFAEAATLFDQSTHKYLGEQS
jgi:hypothetical protein